MWIKNVSIAVTTVVGMIFYGVGLHDTDDTLIYSGVVLIAIGMISAIAVMKMSEDA